jgi:glutamate racemase
MKKLLGFIQLMYCPICPHHKDTHDVLGCTLCPCLKVNMEDVMATKSEPSKLKKKQLKAVAKLNKLEAKYKKQSEKFATKKTKLINKIDKLGAALRAEDVKKAQQRKRKTA